MHRTRILTYQNSSACTSDKRVCVYEGWRVSENIKVIVPLISIVEYNACPGRKSL